VLHTVHKAGKELGLILGELLVRKRKTFEANGEFAINAANHVLDAEVFELHAGVANLLDHAGIFAACNAGVVLGLCTSANEFARSEDKSGASRLTHADDAGSELLRVVLGVEGVHSKLLQVELQA
jgi:hypothetical protein